MDLESDRIMPQMAVTLTSDIGQGWLAGLLVAAPFAAVMSTVDSFLLMISSALVRDIYQRNINPDVSEHERRPAIDRIKRDQRHRVMNTIVIKAYIANAIISFKGVVARHQNLVAIEMNTDVLDSIPYG